MIAARVVFLVVMWGSSIASAAQVEPMTVGAVVRSQLIEVSVLRCRFEQVKRLQGFRNPLLSSGTVLLSRDRGVVWRTTLPFVSTLVLTRKQVVTRSADGTTHAVMRRSASPALLTANELLIALIGGDVDMLSKQFELQETLSDDGSWRLRLVPKSGPLAQMFEHIDLRGDRYVRTVSLAEASGDQTDIRFLDPSHTPDHLTASEVIAFE